MTTGNRCNVARSAVDRDQQALQPMPHETEEVPNANLAVRGLEHSVKALSLIWCRWLVEQITQ
ncbi:hypothetical protein DP64_08380 [Stutzerimonas degradans]|nr:hypothetical protein DP64_08380 [Stutzerimonas degradans]